MFDIHISQLHKRVHGIVMFLNRIKEFFKKSVRITVVQSLTLSITNYGISVWGATSNTHVERVQKKTKKHSKSPLEVLRRVIMLLSS